MMSFATFLLVLAALPQEPAADDPLARAAVLGAEGRFAEAVAVLEEAGAAESDDPELRLALATWKQRALEADLAAGKPELQGLAAVDAWYEVADLFRDATRAPGAGPAAWVGWSEALLNANDADAALEAAQEGLTRFRDDPDLLMQQARVLGVKSRTVAGLGKEEEAAELAAAAESVLRRAVEVAPDRAAPRLRLAESLVLKWAQGGEDAAAAREEAVRLWKEAAEAEPEGVNPQAAADWLGGDAVAVLDVLVARDPENVDLKWYRGLAAYQADPVDWPTLAADMQAVLEFNPAFTMAHFYLGDGALKRATELAQAGDDAATGKAIRAAARHWAKYLESNLAAYAASARQAADGGAALAERMTWLAGKAYAQGLPNEAAKIMELVVALKPQDAYAWQNLAFFRREARAYEDSLAAYDRALQLAPDDPQIMNDLAVILHYYLKRDRERAAELYRTAAERAEAMLASGELADADVERIRTALRDAGNNLKKLEAGSTDPN